MIFCPRCKNSKSTINNTREIKKGRWRRRACKACGFKFTTIETVVIQGGHDEPIPTRT